MTKKEFKEMCSFHVYGHGRNKRNAIYFGWKSGENFRGYKYMVKASIENASKAELFNILYDWVVNEVQPSWYVIYKIAAEDKNRFKVSLVG